MRVGGADYNQEAARAVRIISVLITPVLALYAFLIMNGIIESRHYINEPVTISVSVLWVLMSLFYYFRPSTAKSTHLMRLVLIHFFALMMFTCVTGYAQPFAPLFLLLFLASHLYFGYLGLAVSVFSLIGAATIDAMVRYTTYPSIVAENGLTVFAIIFLGFAVIGIINAQETRRQTLLHSQRRERLQYDRLLTIINNLTDAAFTTDEKGSILMYNAACLDLLDTNDSLKGKKVSELFNLTDKDNKPVKLITLLQEATRAIRRDDINHTYSDGETIRLEITYAPIRSSFSVHKKGDELRGYILIMRDVTKQKSLEDERDEFISVVSHELRTPITIVEGTLSNIDVLMKRDQKPNQKVLESSIETAHEQVLYLAKMVNDLSTLSRAERGVADEAEDISVKELMHSLHQKYEKDAEANKLHLNLDLGHNLGVVSASRLYLEELLQNFITNAIKYTREGSVTIAAHRKGDTITFAVQDTGIGISRTDQTNIFNKFYRSEDYRIRETNGTGLGLYVSAKLAKKLNTHIELKSRLNHGSTFSFELPVK